MQGVGLFGVLMLLYGGAIDYDVVRFVPGSDIMSMCGLRVMMCLLIAIATLVCRALPLFPLICIMGLVRATVQPFTAAPLKAIDLVNDMWSLLSIRSQMFELPANIYVELLWAILVDADRARARSV